MPCKLNSTEYARMFRTKPSPAFSNKRMALGFHKKNTSIITRYTGQELKVMYGLIQHVIQKNIMLFENYVVQKNIMSCENYTADDKISHNT